MRGKLTRRIPLLAFMLLLVVAASAELVNLAGAILTDLTNSSDSAISDRVNGALAQTVIRGSDQEGVEGMNQAGAHAFIGKNDPVVVNGLRSAARHWEIYE